MDDVRDGVMGVWRVSRSARLVGYLLAVGPACGALSAWWGVVSHPDKQNAESAGAATAFALFFALFAWWVLLRVRLELTTDTIVMVNPWGTQHLPWSRVTEVTLGNWGARFHTTDGFTYTAYALSDLASGTRQDDRFADVKRMSDAQLATRVSSAPDEPEMS
ncbi:PH domain-containing protein [Streptomyces prunicolor]|uniref:PH domain-containing protein n=1 Tax=Streptomyces prunicolor TaxID=67348 RepID=A0ABU4FD29_9ACTN|nr:PH domain-containing protein [Streptomyces prunicolor]MDV7217896.1 PH domain-containing protein [Streptomyces prunicolor]